MQNEVQRISSLLRSSHPLIAVKTYEEQRFIRAMLDLGKKIQKNIQVASCLGIHANGNPDAIKPSDMAKILNEHKETKQSVLIILDIQHFLKTPQVFRTLKSTFEKMKVNGSSIIMVAPWFNIPDELLHETAIVEIPLPEREEYGKIYQNIASSVQAKEGAHCGKEKAQDGATGLTLEEAENAFAFSIAHHGHIKEEAVNEAKISMVRQSRLAEVINTKKQEMGGFQKLKAFVKEQIIPFQNHPLLKIKGILLVGVSGTGKSLFSKIIAEEMGLPLIRISISSLKDSLVGKSEQNLREALKIVESISPCVMWMDELEKSVAGHGGHDSGVSSGMLEILLYWLQEHNKNVLTVATCNEFKRLPVELVRPGRFDERFFLDIPRRSERKEIIKIHTNKIDMKLTQKQADRMIELSENWTGAEIEYAVKMTARVNARNNDLNRSIEEAFGSVKPMFETRKAEIAELRDWGNANLLIANDADVERSETAGERRITAQA